MYIVRLSYSHTPIHPKSKYNNLNYKDDGFTETERETIKFIRKYEIWEDPFKVHNQTMRDPPSDIHDYNLLDVPKDVIKKYFLGLFSQSL